MLRQCANSCLLFSTFITNIAVSLYGFPCSIQYYISTILASLSVSPPKAANLDILTVSFLSINLPQFVYYYRQIIRNLIRKVIQCTKTVFSRIFSIKLLDKVLDRSLIFCIIPYLAKEDNIKFSFRCNIVIPFYT